jgi:hypothetical protein
MSGTPTSLSGVVLGTAAANVLKSFPFCLDVEGVSSPQAAKAIYNIANLTSKINEKLISPGFRGTIPGFTIQGNTATMIKIGMWKPDGFYYLKPLAGGRRTQKKRRQTSKKFTQRKR